MPRYHFNIHDGVSVLDPEGSEFVDWEQDIQEAIRYTGEVFRDNAKRLALGEDWRLKVTDHMGLVLCSLDFRLHKTAATMNMRPKVGIDPKTFDKF